MVEIGVTLVSDLMFSHSIREVSSNDHWRSHYSLSLSVFDCAVL